MRAHPDRLLTALLNKSLRRGVALAVVSLLMVGPTAAAGVVSGSPTTPPAPTKPGPYIIVLKDGASPTTNARGHGVAPTHVYRAALNGYSGVLSELQLQAVATDPSVAFVSPDETFTIAAKPSPSPSPTQPAQVITAHNRRIGLLDSPTADVDGIDERVDVDIAILDTGIDSTHPDLNVVGGVDCTSSGKGYEDQEGHGTLVAGIAAAIDNSIGVVDGAPGGRLWSVQVLNKQAIGTKSALLCGIDWVTAHANVIEVANMSITGDGSDDGNCGLTKNDPLHQAICTSVASGVTYVVAAGNESDDSSLYIPASYDEVITVSGMVDTDGVPGGFGAVSPCEGDPDDTFAWFSNFGSDIDLSAPGECISGPAPGGGYTSGSGTSFSAPQVTGAAALYIATHSGATPAQVRTALIDRAEPGPITGDPDAFPEGVVNVAGL